ncbi:mannitol dehydrogenase family protein [Sphingomonas crusticola]|uniref:mannitol dehydrogenase family protein n=1 Tax=Sphingomonas crusticola TaxID=1697973 RepID=UPI000E21E8BB|nr:mannitol dehydrogenase family protein [Sphingomonas crusticola]
MIRLDRAGRSGFGNAAGPHYDATAVGTGIVHLGLGGFHRAHMARYSDELMNLDPGALEWGIAGVGLRPQDARLIAALQRQDGLYTLVEQEGERQEAFVIGAIARAIFAGDRPALTLAALANKAVRIVSLTVTENGYHLERATKRLDLASPEVRHDLANPRVPHTAIGALAEALDRRRRAGEPGFTILCCDNIQHNGDVLRAAVLAFAEARGQGLADWISQNTSFPNSMVDRITPVAQPAQIAAFRDRYQLEDAAPIFAERFRQWVIEDRFLYGRPAWEKVGAQFVGDVTPYEMMKLRLLNCSHLAISGLGQLAGYHLISDVMSDAAIVQYMRALMDLETGPTLAPVPGVDLDHYKQTIIERFANIAIEDTVERVNTDAPLNLLLDPLRDRLRRGEGIELLALALAAWLRRVRGEDEQHRPVAVSHPLASLLREKALEGGADPLPLLSITSLFGEVGEHPVLHREVGRWLASLYQYGARETLRRAVEAGVF